LWNYWLGLGWEFEFGFDLIQLSLSLRSSLILCVYKFENRESRLLLLSYILNPPTLKYSIHFQQKKKKRKKQTKQNDSQIGKLNLKLAGYTISFLFVRYILYIRYIRYIDAIRWRGRSCWLGGKQTKQKNTHEITSTWKSVNNETFWFSPHPPFFPVYIDLKYHGGGSVYYRSVSILACLLVWFCFVMFILFVRKSRRNESDGYKAGKRY
jgi:hypothetical protein